jgi:site-specific DNA-methyltransferase (adenine-specific)
VEPVYQSALGRLYQGDCMELLAATGDSEFDLIFADPPFNLGKDYGKSVSDSLRDDVYLAWCESWKYSLPIQGKLYPSHYSLLYYVKGKPRAFKRPRVPIPVCRHCGGDIKDYGGDQAPGS